YYPRACDIVLMPAKVKQSYTTISAQTYLKYWVHFTAIVGDRPIFQLIDTPVVLKLSSTAYEHARGLMSTLRECHLERSWISPIRKHAALLELLHIYFQATGLERIQLRSKDLDKLNIILSYMAENLDKRLTIQELAQQLHLHPNYFITYFKEHMGESPIQYMNHMKLEHAKQLLLGNTLHVNEIAERIGMDAYYFSRIFKEYTGFSPTAYMASKMIQNG
ncbi:helix-turn-helix transcriptional regulator, partial [Paenibacillus sp. 1001270B_150601_E10]|uniref:helix-turn-helix transcriptional regulator n=1 Tax=Paenibacillus sp. 1001270B_150601_E10 TaxID=2787079 RepID=UPI001E51A694